MPLTLEIPICSVNVEKMRYLDTRNVENLHGIWSVFSKCARSIEDGARLENLSWRIWNRETLCCEPHPQSTATPKHPTAKSCPKRTDIPELSSSIDSAESMESNHGGVEEQSRSQMTAPRKIKPPRTPKVIPALNTSHGREKHITSLRLEKMVSSIQEKQSIGPLSPTIVDAVPSVMPSTDITPRPKSPTFQAPLRSSDSSSSTAPMSSPGSDRSMTHTVGSDTSAEIHDSDSVVRGFSPGQASSSYRSHTHLAQPPMPHKPVSHNKNEASKKGVFLLGGSSGEDESSFEDHMLSQPKQSSLTTGLKRPNAGKKQTSFRDEVEARTMNNKSHKDEVVFESDDEVDMLDSAIEDDSEDEIEDEDEWEDDGSESGDNTINDKPLFQRVDSKPDLVSRRSLLTSLMNEGDRAAAFANMAKSTPALRKSRTQTLIDPSMSIPTHEDVSAGTKPIIMTTSNTQLRPMAFSPRTTRRNMLASEMTESLRKAVLYERQQKKSTSNAVLKRRHTAHDVTNLTKYPGEDDEQSGDGSRNNSWNHFFGGGGVGDYHQAGW